MTILKDRCINCELGIVETVITRAGVYFHCKSCGTRWLRDLSNRNVYKVESQEAEEEDGRIEQEGKS